MKKYAYAFVAEAKHFLTSNPEIVKQISEHGQSYRLVKKKTPVENELDNPMNRAENPEHEQKNGNTETTDSNPTPKKFTGTEKKTMKPRLDRFSKPPRAHPPKSQPSGSDLDVTEVG